MQSKGFIKVLTVALILVCAFYLSFSFVTSHYEGIAADYAKAKALITDIVTSHPLTLDDPAPFIRMSEHADSAIVITARAWVKSGDYWTVHFDLLETVKKAFDENGIEVPYNQLDVHVKNS